MDIENFINRKNMICVVGLGYVGLPLALLLGKKYRVTGFDIDERRIRELSMGYDRTNEIDEEELKKATITLTNEESCIIDASIIIVTVPTPIDNHNIPDLKSLTVATKIIGKNLQKGRIVVYESTVYPGVTEDICVPILEIESGLIWKKDFFVGYSPERINPGDRIHTIDKIIKVVAGDTEETAETLLKLYGSVISAGIYKAPSIKVAEAAKVIENTQRDLNISLMNELSMIFNRMEIDTKEVLKAACTKWNFLSFEPGLVGGHCIGVDPYYLTFKAEEIGYHPEVILAGRRINDSMGKYIAENVIKTLIKGNITVNKANVLIMGFAFKENIGDIRNTKVIDILHELKDFGVNISIFDPLVHSDEVKKEYNIELIDRIDKNAPYDAIIVAVKHDKFKEYNIEYLKEISKNPFLLFDVKSIYDKDKVIAYGGIYWRL